MGINLGNEVMIRRIMTSLRKGKITKRKGAVPANEQGRYLISLQRQGTGKHRKRIIGLMASSYYEERIHRLLTEVSSGQLQMRISSVPDRNLAIALDMLLTEDRDSVLSLLPAAKAVRVRQEQAYLGRLKISAAQKRVMAEGLAEAMEGRSGSAGGTWIAPGSRKEDRR